MVRLTCAILISVSFVLVSGYDARGHSSVNTVTQCFSPSMRLPDVGHEALWIAGENIRGLVRNPSHGLLVVDQPSEPPSIRTRFSLVNAAMALLATFDEAEVLPPEGSSLANQIIHAVIQMQSALVKSRDAELQKFVSDAIRHQGGKDWEGIYRNLSQQGLSSRILEGILTYSPNPALWENPALIQAIQQFNVTESDWGVVKTIFFKARDVYSKQGKSIHEVYESWRAKMP